MIKSLWNLISEDLTEQERELFIEKDKLTNEICNIVSEIQGLPDDPEARTKVPELTARLDVLFELKSKLREPARAAIRRVSQKFGAVVYE
jgi:hypothetical protein